MVKRSADVNMIFSFFKSRFTANAKVEADGDLLIALLGDGALATATAKAVKSARNGEAKKKLASQSRSNIR